MNTPLKIGVILAACAVSAVPARGGNEDQEQRVRAFVVMGYQGIYGELAAAKGPYVRTLLDLLRTPPEAESRTADQLRALIKRHPNIMDFADQVLLLRAGGPSGAAAANAAPAMVPDGPGVYSGEDLVNALEHLTRGMAVTVHMKTGEQLKGTFSDYAAKRLWLRGASRRSIQVDEILALEAPQL